MASDPLPLEFVLYGKLVYLTGHVWGLVCFLGCQSSWQTAAESQRPPRGSALACPHCLAGDRSDTEANTCSSEEGDLAKRWPLYNPPIHTLDSQHTHSCTHMPNVYHPWQVTWDWTLRSMFPLGTLLSLCSFSFTHSNTQQFVQTPETERLLHQHIGDPESTRPSPATQMFSITGTFVVSAAL